MSEKLATQQVDWNRVAPWTRLGVLLSIAMSACAMGQSLQPKPLVVQRAWRAEDGLPTHNIRALAESKDHILWIGESHGLYRFDGITFTKVPLMLGAHDVASDIPIACLLPMEDGRLLVGTEGEGLLIVSEGKVTRALVLDGGQRPQVIRTLLQDHSGKIWVGADQGLFRLGGDGVAPFKLQTHQELFFVRAIAEDHKGTLLVGGSRLLRIVGGEPEEIPLPKTREQEIVTGIAVDRNGDTWIGTFSGLFRLSGRSLTATSIRVPVVSLLTDRKQQTFAVVESGKISTLGLKRNWSDQTPFYEIKDAVVLTDDLQGVLWIGTDHSLIRAIQTPIRQYELPSRSRGQGISLTLSANEVLLADGRLYSGSDKGFHPVALPTTVTKVSTALRDRDGSLWVGTHGSGLYHLSGRGVQHFTINKGMPNDFIKMLLQARDGSIWIATDGGVGKIDRSGIHSYQVPGGLAYFSVTALFEDKKSDVWIGTSRGLSHLHQGQFVQDDATHQLASEIVLSITQLASGTFIIGTDSGLFAISSSGVRRVPLSDGANAATSANLISDGRGQLWMSNVFGVACFREGDIESAAIDGSKPNPLAFLSAEEIGYRSLTTGPPPAAVLTANHKLLIGTNLDLLEIDTKSFQIDAPPRVKITALRTNNVNVAMADFRTAKLSQQAQNIEIEFAAQSVGPQDRLRYQYQMEGVEHDWSQAAMRRIAYYTTLSPGTHRFRVRVAEIGAPGFSESELVVYQSPHFYQRWLFRVLVIALAGLSVATIIWLRSRQIQLRYAAVLQERTRLAREMHDTLIQGCTSTSAFLEAYDLTVQKAGREYPTFRAEEFLERAREQLTRTITEARAAVWNLRSEDSTSKSLGEAIRENIARTRRPAVDIEFNEDDRSVSLSREQVFELSLISREALNNALKHSNTDRITIDISTTEEHLLLRIIDYGRGFDHLTIGSLDGHYGITGMKERAARLSGAVRLEGGPGDGTAVNVIIPLWRKGL